jgi:hypothetical protein
MKNTIILDTELDYIELETATKADMEQLVVKQSDSKLELIGSSVGDHPHYGVMEYMSMAYNNHKGIVITPHLIWYTFMTELASHIKKMAVDHPKRYQHVFTDSDQKVEINVPTNSPTMMPMGLLREEIIKNINVDAGMFFPEFSQEWGDYEFAISTAFADALSPYFTYTMTLCGIPKVLVDGTDEDWQKIIDSLKLMQDVFTDDTIMDYLKRVTGLVSTMRQNNSIDFWKDMFFIESCGSGHTNQVKGWFRKFFMVQPSNAQVQNYPTAVSHIAYKETTMNAKFELFSGVLSSHEEDGFLYPHFDFVLTEDVG